MRYWRSSIAKTRPASPMVSTVLLEDVIIEESG
jgi:hypothetical protein